jgi:hypothetical protein
VPYKVYIDDSGTDGVLFKLDGTRQKNPQLCAAIGGILVPQVHEASLEAEWNNLREKIAGELGLTELPPIHMRLMWGKCLPDEISAGVPNPFLLATREQIKGWVEDALELLDRFRRSRGLLHFGFWDAKDQLASRYQGYFGSPLWAHEYATIAAADKEVLKAYHNAAANPLPEMLAHALFYLDQVVAQQRMRTAHVIYDRNPSAKGFEISEAMEAIQANGNLQTIKVLQAGGHMADVLLQAADIVAFRTNRRGLDKVRGTVDPIFADWTRRFPMTGGTWIHNNNIAIDATVIRYDVARRAASDISDTIVDTLFVDTDEFRRRLREELRLFRLGRAVGGIAVLKQP